MKYASTLFFFIFTIGQAMSQNHFAALQGKVLDSATHEALPFVNVKLLQNEIVVYETSSDFDGMFLLDSLKASCYDVVVQSFGYTQVKLTAVYLNADEVNLLGSIHLSVDARQKITQCIFNIPLPLILFSKNPDETVISRDEIRHMPTRQ